MRDFVAGVGMAEDRQAERRLGDEEIAGDRLEGSAGRIGRALVIARHDDARALRLDGDLGRAEDVAGRMEAHRRIADPDLLAEPGDLPRPGKGLAAAQRHDGERLARRQHGAMAGARMVGMAMRDQGARDPARAGRYENRRARNRARPG